MNDIDIIKESLCDLDERLDIVEDVNSKRPYYLYGRKDSVRRLIAVFSEKKFFDSFINECKLKKPKKNQLFKKNTPFFYWESFDIEREYIPDYVFFNPTLEIWRSDNND